MLYGITAFPLEKAMSLLIDRIEVRLIMNYGQSLEVITESEVL